ncbi:MAG: sugar ABC transporter ATP-binding protein [Lachnospiraceae bacterium]|nr:sugar ABC transporter ATP-binding protein [Lachnospiraceae bacterium]
MGKEIILKCEHICKSFGVTKALADVPLEVSRGEIRGLIGENGSGKSTISSIVAGVQPYDSGSMTLNGEPFEPKTMIEAQKRGVAMVVQEMGTISGITVAANIFVGKEGRYVRNGILNVRRMNQDAQEILDKIGAGHIQASYFIDEFDFEDRKLVEIARAMFDEPQIFIVDETTTALSQKGRDIVYKIMRDLSVQNKAVLFISHDLDELMGICNAITVLRDGKFIATMTQEEMNIRQMRQFMVGREVSDNYYRSDHDGSFGEEVVLRAEQITNGILENFSFELHKGEILGIGGLSEAGMHELGRAVFGADKVLTGKVTVADGTIISNPRIAIKKGIAYASKNRDKESIILTDTIGNNITLPSLPQLEKAFYISRKDEEKLAGDEIEKLSVKCQGPWQVVNELSGGNKQKVVFAKWIGNKSDILILDCPTRGIDIGVKEAMYKLMYQLKKEGKSIIMISEELPELLGMSDRVLILKEGKLSGTFERAQDPTESEVIHYMI